MSKNIAPEHWTEQGGGMGGCFVHRQMMFGFDKINVLPRTKWFYLRKQRIIEGYGR